jgi:hypothetical protein
MFSEGIYKFNLRLNHLAHYWGKFTGLQYISLHLKTFEIRSEISTFCYVNKTVVTRI